jgi:type IV fimbrial biogenesis protein FimT
MRLPHAKWEFGFTMIELMVTLAVLAILLVAAAPSFTDFFDKSRVRGAADGVISLIGNARAEAVKTDLDVNVAFKGSAASWCVGANAATPPTGGAPAGSASACDCTDTTKCLVGGQRSTINVGAYPDVGIGTIPGAFVFDSKLGVVSPLATNSVTLTSPRGKYGIKVEVSALGQARLCVPALKPAIAGVAACAP